MRISARTEYGLRAMIELANRYGQGPTGVKEVAASQAMPEKFLEQLISTLRRSGLVISHRGAQGGFVLARPPGEINVFQIMEALEGPLRPVACIGDSESPCAKNASCATQDLWRKAKESLEGVFRSTTLEQLRREQKTYDDAQQLMYYI